MTPDQLQDAEWTPELWDSLNELARKVVEERAQLRRVIPRGPDAPNAYSVNVPKIKINDDASKGEISIDTNTSKSVTRIRCRLKIASHQLHDVAIVRLLVVKAAERLAELEDLVIGLGKNWTSSGKISEKEVENADQSDHLMAPAPGATDRPSDAMGALAKGANAIRANGATGTIHAVLGHDLWDELAKKDVGARVPGIEQAKYVLGSLDAKIVRLPHISGLYGKSATVFSSSPATLDLVWAQPVRLAHSDTKDGDLVLRLEEAFYLRIIDENGLETVTKA